MRRHYILAFMLGSLLIMAAESIDLSGTWRFATGEEPEYTETIQLPGSMLTNGKGDEVTLKTPWVGSLYDSSYYYNPYMARYREPGNMKFPFFLTPDRHYLGTAWYGKTVEVPSGWKNGKIELYLERPHITATVYVNGQEAGRDSTLSVPHTFDLTPYIKIGEPNDISIRIDNTIDNVCVGQDSHSVTDQTQGDWNGIVGSIELRHRPDCRLASVQVYPMVADKAVKVKIAKEGKKGNKTLRLTCKAPDGTTACSKTVKMKADTATYILPLGEEISLWDEHSPDLYTLTASIDGGESKDVSFGMRNVRIDGRQIYLNDHPIWIRGTVGNCCFPLTGYPPTDEESWLQVIGKCKEYGLNAMRFHSYCPPEAAFTAADKLGFYLQPEGPSWPNHGVKLGNGMSIDRYLLEETERMVEEYGNHPSFVMLAAGNEPAGNWVKWVGDFCDYWRATGDDRRIYCGASVGGGWAWDPKSDYHVKGGARGLDWDNRAPQSNDDFYAQITSYTQKGRTPITFDINEPFISHEQGQWCAFPDLTETDQYTGPYKARNFEIFADLLKDNGMEGQAKKFLMASGNLQTLAYKYEIERNLRTPEYAGFQILSLNDYSGQGTALVGVLNVMWREKGYCTADDWTEFCSEVVPLAKFDKFVYGKGETVKVPVELYNALGDLSDVKVTYTICKDGTTIKEKTADYASIDLGKNFDLGGIEYMANTEGKHTLRVKVDSGNGSWNNHWDFWVYPSDSALAETGDIMVTDTLDNAAMDYLQNGGKVLVTAAGKVKYGNDVKQTYLPVFWNTSWFKMRPPHTTGVSIDNEHPLFGNFPTDDWANLNWWELVNKAQVMNLRHFPMEYQSPIQPIDTWHVSRKLGMLVEANVEGGKVLMTTMDITNDLDRRLVARQMRNAILEYMKSDAFEPSIDLEAQTLTMLFEQESTAVDMYTNDSPDELKPKLF